MTTDEEAHIVATHIRQVLKKTEVPADKLTTEEVYQLLLDNLDDFHEYNFAKAYDIAEDVRQAWVMENKNNTGR